LKLRSVLFAAALAVIAVGVEMGTQAQPVAAASTETAAIHNFASRQLSKPFRMGASGMRRFDCSGLVWRTFYETGNLRKISGRQRTSRGYFNWFRNHDRLTKNPRPGDLVVWAWRGRPVSHIGIYTGKDRYGRAMAISALTSGVARHRVRGINIPFKAYLRVGLDR
jgi:cell wall-associated NlpC family hydrolase